MDKRYVVIGAGIAGLSAAEAIRRQDSRGRIVLLSGEAELPYARPMLSKAPLLSMELKKLSLRQPSWYRSQDIDLRLGVMAEELDPGAGTVTLRGGERLAYDKCVLATGARNFIPPFPGREEVPLCDVRTLEDLRRMRRMAEGSKRAVIIGGGVIGLEVAAELYHYGLETTVLEAMDYLMPRLIGPKTSDWLRAQLPGLHVETGVAVAGLRREGQTIFVDEKNGRSWPCELLVVSCGVRADTALAQQAGIACERAIVVNQRMETSAEGVYACGDCAQFQGFNAALWSQGQEQGRVAGTNAAGGCAVYTGCDTSLVLNLDGVALFALGDLGQSGGADYEIEESSWGQRKTFQVDPRRPAVPGRGLRVWKGEKLVGVSLMGDLTKMQAWKTQLLKERDGGK